MHNTVGGTNTTKKTTFVNNRDQPESCLKNIKIVEYESNNKAWMTSEIFQGWLLKINKKFWKLNRRMKTVVFLQT